MNESINKDRLFEILEQWNRFLKRKGHLIARGATAKTLIGMKPSTKHANSITPEAKEHWDLTKQLITLGYNRVTVLGGNEKERISSSPFS